MGGIIVQLPLPNTFTKEDEYNIDINLGKGEGVATVWTTDLSSYYVRINADYRT